MLVGCLCTHRMPQGGIPEHVSVMPTPMSLVIMEELFAS